MQIGIERLVFMHSVKESFFVYTQQVSFNAQWDRKVSLNAQWDRKVSLNARMLEC